MIKNVRLGIFINEFNKKPIFMDLREFKDVYELDHFMDYYYNDNKEARKEFDQDIFEYLLDNMEQLKKVEARTGSKFLGRLSAYYYDEKGNMQYIKLPTKKRKMIRNYRDISDSKKCMEFLTKVFDRAMENIFESHSKANYRTTKNDFIFLMCEAFKSVEYHFSDNEKYYLAIYFNNRTLENKKKCLDLMKINVENFYKRKEEIDKENEYKPTFEEKKEEYQSRLNAPEELASIPYASSELEYNLEMAKKEKDDDYLFKNHDLEEIDKYTNFYQRKRRK